MNCPACGEGPQWCLGHGMIGDPVGYATLTAHDDGDHSRCHPSGCERASTVVVGVES